MTQRQWNFDSPGDEWGGVLSLSEDGGKTWRHICMIEPYGPGHVIDTGRLIQDHKVC